MKPIFLFPCLMSIHFFIYGQNSNGRISLFDGKTLKGWKVLGGTVKFNVEDGVIVGTTALNSANTFLATEKEYGNFILELDVKLESPDGNSGIQTRSHFDPSGNNGKGKVYGRQVEIDPSNRKWTGGIYDEARRKWLYPMDLNPKAQNVYEQGEYNHFKIECIGNEIRTWVNGVACADVVDTIDNEGFIALQVHNVTRQEQSGKKVWFKNIFIKTSSLKPTSFPRGIYVVNHIPNTLTVYEKNNGWKLLFDGKSSKGWVGAYRDSFPSKGWHIQNGALNLEASGGGEASNGGDIVTKEKYKAFDLIKANKPSTSLRPIGQWNIGRIIVYPNNHVEHYLNGVKVLEYERGSQAYRDLVAISKYKVWDHFGEAPEGRILLQEHGHEVSFRSIKIREMR